MIDTSEIDRIALLISDTRILKRMSLEKLSNGICSTSYLSKLENGKRDMSKLMTDALLQRLGLFSEQFSQVIFADEFFKWDSRRKISDYIFNEDIGNAKKAISAYVCNDNLEKQFILAAMINISWLENENPANLLPLVEKAIKYTQPHFTSEDLNNSIFSELEGYLIFAWFKLQEMLYGTELVFQSYVSLLSHLCSSYYDSRESAYLLPYVAYHVAKIYYDSNSLSTALRICHDAQNLLMSVKRLEGYYELITLEKQILDKMGIHDEMPCKLLENLKLTLRLATPRKKLLIPYEERGMVFCVNQVIKTRRIAFGISQENLADGICDVRTLSRVETMKNSPQKKNCKKFQQKLGMSGDRYNHQIISQHYGEYEICANYERLRNNRDEKAIYLFCNLKNCLSNDIINMQYLSVNEIYLRDKFGKTDENFVSLDEQIIGLQNALFKTFPIDLDKLDSAKVCILSVNEIYIMLILAEKLKMKKMYQKSQAILRYVVSSLKISSDNILPYANIYVYFLLQIASYASDIGNYNESNHLTKHCINVCLKSNNTESLAACIERLSINLEQQRKKLSDETNEKKISQIYSLLQQAYTISIISGDSVTKIRIENHCKKLYGMNNIF
jgi:transcriptional regulator with XRE-family HTH domain/phosphotransferase system IIB component